MKFNPSFKEKVLYLIYINKNMNETEDSKTKNEIKQILKSFDEVYAREGSNDELSNFLHKNIFIITPDEAKRVNGKIECISTWKKRYSGKKIYSWNAYDHEIHVYGNGEFAVMSYYFDMIYDVKGKKTNYKGRDMIVLVKENEKWLIVADQFSPSP